MIEPQRRIPAIHAAQNISSEICSFNAIIRRIRVGTGEVAHFGSKRKCDMKSFIDVEDTGTVFININLHPLAKGFADA
jgi:hypothetical protein